MSIVDRCIWTAVGGITHLFMYLESRRRDHSPIHVSGQLWEGSLTYSRIWRAVGGITHLCMYLESRGRDHSPIHISWQLMEGSLTYPFIWTAVWGITHLFTYLKSRERDHSPIHVSGESWEGGNLFLGPHRLNPVPDDLRLVRVRHATDFLQIVWTFLHLYKKKVHTEVNDETGQ